jgi:hypothetical protein
MRTNSATDFASILRMTCHMTSGPDNTNHALALAFGVLVVFMVVAGFFAPRGGQDDHFRTDRLREAARRRLP